MTRNGYRGHLTLNRSPKDKVHTGYRRNVFLVSGKAEKFAQLMTSRSTSLDLEGIDIFVQLQGFF